MLAAALLLAACGGTSNSSAQGTFDQVGAGPVIRLEAQGATLDLPASNLPDGALPTGAFDLPAQPATPVDEHRTAWVFPLPFPSTTELERFAPPGMQVWLEAEPQPYDMSPYAPEHTGWRLKDGALHVIGPASDQARAARIVHPHLVTESARLEVARSGLQPADYAAYAFTHEGTTRTGVLLPAPGVATWQVTVPPGARFRAAPLVLTPPTAVPTDGAVVELRIDDVPIERVGVSREGVLRALGRHEATWQVDLSAHAGKTVRLSLHSLPGGDPVGDYLFLGSPTVWGEPTGPVRRVVVIGLDTTRPDHLGLHGYGRDTSPELDAWAAGATVFDKAWATAPRTRPSFRSSMTGRSPLEAIGAPGFGRVFRDHGFATAGIVANIHLNDRFGFTDGFDWWHLHAASTATGQVDLALDWLGSQADRDALLFLHFMDPHLHYNPPEPYRRRLEQGSPWSGGELFNRWTVYAWDEEGLLHDDQRAWIESLYDGELAYLSAELGRFFAELDKLPGQTLVVLHSDHGEEFWEHGGFEHNHSLYDELVRALLVVRPPGGAPARLTEPVSIMDIAPTLYDYAGFTDAPPSEGRSLRPLIEGDEGGWARDLPVAHLMYDLEQWGVVHQGHKYLIETDSGLERLYDLSADPGEHTDLSASRDLAPFRAALGRAHHMTVGPGWRVRLVFSGPAPLRWKLPAQALDAGVIDPEAAQTARANQVWGELPTMTAGQVAEVALSQDGTELTLTPSEGALGTVFVRFAKPPEQVGELSLGGAPLTPAAMARGGWALIAPDLKLQIEPGTVFRTPADEATRMGLLSTPDSAELRLLRELGYLAPDGPSSAPR